MFSGKKKFKKYKRKITDAEDKEFFSSSKKGKSNELSSFKRRKDKLKQKFIE